MSSKHFLLVTLFISFTMGLWSQPIDFSNISMENKIYHPDILSMKVEHATMDFALPITILNSREQLILTFDDESDESKYLKYTYIHCTYDWKPTPNFQHMDYMNAFMEGDIVDFQTAFSTLQFYTTYSLAFPNDEVGVNKSGNYILYVYEDDNGEHIPFLTHRFTIAEKLVEILPNVRQPTDISIRNIKQEVSFQIKMANFRINNASKTLKVVISQNGRSDNAYVATTPTVTLNDGLQYNRSNEILFEGGSEFRIFNIRSLRSNMEHISRHTHTIDQNYTYVDLDKERVYLAYEEKVDIDGCYFIATDDGYSLQNADYTNVYFSLSCTPPKDVDLYVYGELTNWNLSPHAKMEYHPYRKQWEASLYLKTGYYNYTYLALPKGSTAATFMYTEGNFWQTENRYTFLAYYQGDGLLYDRVIGYAQHFSFTKGVPEGFKFKKKNGQK